ncbi:MAG: hypothetical protein HC926_03705 [Synechococcaceae cyanobacterium SM2_3_60]|nr:hypothetical protein [Synechococcaceae cyanobacterium SM2_3_60]
MIKYISVTDFSLGVWFIYGDKGQTDTDLKTEIPILKVRFLANQTYEVLELAGLRQPPQDPKPTYSCDDDNLYFHVTIPESDEELVFTGEPKSVNQISGRVISTAEEEDRCLVSEFVRRDMYTVKHGSYHNRKDSEVSV